MGEAEGQRRKLDKEGYKKRFTQSERRMRREGSTGGGEMRGVEVGEEGCG